MTTIDRQKHWETIYTTKQLNEVSWYQPTPKHSLDLIGDLQLDKTAKIIDVGGGDSFLVDHLLDLGFENISVLDISENAIERAKKRLGPKAEKVNWIVSDITEFEPKEKYDLWHDRAAFHFLNTAEDVSSYGNVLKNGLTSEGKVVIGTFSENGPKKCSGIEITQYTPQRLSGALGNDFRMTSHQTKDHPTPFDTIQNFLFCTFEKTN